MANITDEILDQMHCLHAALTETCWEIASNSNCDLESQLGFLVEEWKINLGYLVIEEKVIP